MMASAVNREDSSGKARAPDIDRDPGPKRPSGFDRAGPSLMDVAREPPKRWKGKVALGVVPAKGS